MAIQFRKSSYTLGDHDTAGLIAVPTYAKDGLLCPSLRAIIGRAKDSKSL